MRQTKLLLIVLIFLAPSFAIDKVYVFDIIFQGNANIKSMEFESLLRLQKKTSINLEEKFLEKPRTLCILSDKHFLVKFFLTIN